MDKFNWVLLANPPWKGIRAGSRWPRWCEVVVPGQGYVPFPFFLAYTREVLEKYTTTNSMLLDCIADQIDKEKFISEVFTLQPDLLVLETCALSREVDIETARLIKEQAPEIKICMVGPYASAEPFYFFQTGLIDYVVRGEYEMAIRSLVNGHLIDGIMTPTNSMHKKTQLVGPLDFLPFPHRDITTQKNYTTGFARDYPNVQQHTSRGCIYRCSFCLWPNTLYQNKFRAFSTKYVITEMEYIMNEFPDTKEISFDDDTFTLRKDIPKLSKQIIDKFKNEISWNCLGHVGSTTKEELEWMGKSGCEKVAWGFEVYGAEARKRLRKGVRPDRFEQVARWCLEFGIEVHGTFMVGLPGETIADGNATIEYIERLKDQGLLNHAQKSICTPFPGTPLFYEAKEKGWLVTEDLQRFDGTRESVLSYPNFTKEEIEDVFRRMPVSGG